MMKISDSKPNNQGRLLTKQDWRHIYDTIKMVFKRATDRAQEHNSRRMIKNKPPNHPINEEEALRYAAKMVESHFKDAPCDNEAVSSCVRCNAYHIACGVDRLLKHVEQLNATITRYEQQWVDENV